MHAITVISAALFMAPMAFFEYLSLVRDWNYHSFTVPKSEIELLSTVSKSVIELQREGSAMHDLNLQDASGVLRHA